MNKEKIIFKIESYSTKDGTLLLSLPSYETRTLLKGIVDLCEKKHGGYLQAELSPPYKSRTTGKDSQNNKIWAMITEIARETGNDITDIEEYVKLQAVKRGYPFKVNRLTGAIKPKSMAKINTVEASYLIDELYALAGEYGINLD